MLVTRELSKAAMLIPEWMESNTWCPLLTAAMILSGLAVHVDGFGSAFVSATKRLMMADWRSTTEQEDTTFQATSAELWRRTPRQR